MLVRFVLRAAQKISLYIYRVYVARGTDGFRHCNDVRAAAGSKICRPHAVPEAKRPYVAMRMRETVRVKRLVSMCSSCPVRDTFHVIRYRAMRRHIQKVNAHKTRFSNGVNIHSIITAWRDLE